MSRAAPGSDMISNWEMTGISFISTFPVDLSEPVL